MGGAAGTSAATTAAQETIGGYVVPLDPMDELGCESCQ